ncbi:Septin-domain-containing protein [Radiomyces spectabilis]|uniref:Septin-domain-containing protein n=1 Tax=Radiomyces spectabilis TaxID=64574 RepID=UPI00221FED4B|nr:Septin-domain-containing protein [Radiomyces spectabilis]KAI8390889.1 Septin-domain-containing protein [Radiomyces spectabilis]
MSPRSRKNAVSHFNIMVVGFSGAGKTSFIRTLLESLKMSMPHDKRNSFFHQPELPSEAHGPLQKTASPYTISMNIEVDGEKVALTLIDTPGFQTEYMVDKQLQDIVGYMEHQFDLALNEETKVKRNPKAVDTQVHACLYFLDPSKRTLGEYDIRILNRLAQRANVIPVVGKADTLTAAQRRRLRPAIMESIYNVHKIPIYGMPEDDEEDDEDEDEDENENANIEEKRDEADAAPPLDEFLQQFDYNEEDEETQAFIDYLRMIPYSVIAYEDEPETGRPIEIEGVALGRDYGWVTIDCLSDKYSHFISLKDMLLGTHRRILQSETVERYYERYRTERLLIKRATKLKSMDVGQKILEDLNHL